MNFKRVTGPGVGRALVLLLAFALVTGCSSNKSRVGSMFNVDTDVHLTLIADGSINPGNQGSPAPLFIRLYELKSSEAFHRADFIDLYENDEAVLGNDLVNQRQLSRLAPGESREERVVLRKDTRYIGLFAEFYDYEGSTYHTVMPVIVHNVRRNQVTVRVTENRLSLVQ
jgi:type VI secretion system protein VasD